VHLVSDPAFAPTPLVPVIIDIDTAADIGPGVMDFNASYSITCHNVDPNHPPMLIGVRLFARP
jgi:hypothetical protein